MEKQLKPTENDINNANVKAFKKLRFLDRIIFEAKELNKKIGYTKLVHTNRKIFYFNIFRRLADFSRSMFCADSLIEEAINKQN